MATSPARRVPRRSDLTPYPFLVPSLFILAVFLLFPVASALVISLQEFSALGAGTWVGFDNYLRLLSDKAFHNALFNTFYYTGVSVPISIGLALMLAVLLNAGIKGRTVFRTAIFLPFVAPLAIAAIAWTFLLDPDIGMATPWLRALGINLGGWVRDSTWAMPAVIIVGIWKNVGFFMVLYLAGLQQIPREFGEAAAVDGANPWQRFRHVTWPLLSNVTLFVVVIAMIGALQAFDQIFVMTHGGPFFKTETIVMIIYREGITNLEIGYASAISFVLMLLVFFLSFLQIRFFGRREIRY